MHWADGDNSGSLKVLSSVYIQLHGNSSVESIINLPYAVLMLPPMVVGGLLGVYLYTWLPEIFQLVLYVFTAILASCMGFKKGIGLWKSETEGASSAGQLGVGSPPCVTEDTVLPSVTSRARSSSLSLKYKKAILITILLAVWTAVILSRLLLGSSSTPSMSHSFSSARLSKSMLYRRVLRRAFSLRNGPPDVTMTNTAEN